jgi:hypothetical protein
MSNKRRRFAASQKAAIALEVLKEEKSVAQIAAENSVLPEPDPQVEETVSETKHASPTGDQSKAVLVPSCIRVDPR